MVSVIPLALSITAFGFAGWTLREKGRLSKKDFNKNLLIELAIGIIALFFAIK